MGVGLGLAGYQPDELDLKQVQQAVRVSEELEIEQTMFEDKLKTTDWEATNEAIEEQIARESYLQWCRENLQRTKKSVSSTVTSQSSLSMPGSSSGSSMVTMMGGGSPPVSAAAAATAASIKSPSTGSSAAECNGNSTATTLISCESGVSPAVSVVAAASPLLGGRMSPKQQQYQSDDGVRGFSGSSTSTSTASSSSCGSSSLLGEGSFDGMRQRRRRRRQQSSHHSSQNIPERGGDLPRVSPPELVALNLVETRSTDSNDSDFSDETLSKKIKRRLEGEEQQHERNGDAVLATKEGEVEVVERGEHKGSSVELQEPGPSKGGPEGTTKQRDNFYHSLLESSYMDDGEWEWSRGRLDCNNL